MADTTKDLRVIFTGDTTDLSNAFRKIRNEADQTDAKMKTASKQWDEGIAKMGSSLKVLGIALGGSIALTASLGVVAAGTFAVFGAGLLAVTAGIIGLAVYGSDSAKTLKAQFHDSLNSIKKDFDSMIAPFKGQIDQIAKSFNSGFVQAFKNFTPALTNLLNTMLPLFKQFTSNLPAFGTFMAGQFNMIINAFKSVLSMGNLGIGAGLKNFINGLDTLIADLIKIGGPLIGPVLTAFGNLASSLGGSLLTAFHNNRQAIETLITSVIKIISNVLNLIGPIISLVSHLSGLTSFIANHKWIVDALVGSFIALKVAIFMKGAAEAFSGAMKTIFGVETEAGVRTGGLIGTMKTLQATVAAPMVMGAIAIAGALADIALVYAAIQGVRGAIADLNASAASAENAGNQQAAMLRQLQGIASGSIKSKYVSPSQAKAELNKYASQGYAGGTNYAQGGWAMVGEKGPELMKLPRGSQVMNNDDTQKTMGAGGSVHLTVNVGVVAGNNVQDLAQTIYRELQRIARANGFNGALPAIGVKPTG